MKNDDKENHLKNLVKKYDELRDKELELIAERHNADKLLQLIRFELDQLSQSIMHKTDKDVNCW